jgi:putative transposase
LGQHRSAQREVPRGADDEQALAEDIIAVEPAPAKAGGFRRETALLQSAGSCMNRKNVEGIWRRESLKVPQKQPKRRRLWLNDGSSIQP